MAVKTAIQEYRDFQYRRWLNMQHAIESAVARAAVVAAEAEDAQQASK